MRAVRLDATRAWISALLLTVGNVLSVLDRLIVSVLAEPIKADLILSDVQLALLQGPAFAILYATLGIPFGRLADITNRRRLAALAIAAWSLCTAACGLARSFPALLVARIGVGAGEAALAPAAFSMFGDSFGKDRLGRAIAAFAVGGALGSGLSLVIGGALFGFFSERGVYGAPFLGALEPWQMTFIAVGLPGLLGALLVAGFVREPERSKSEEENSFGAVLAEIWRERRFYLFALAAFAAHGAVLSGFLNWAPIYLIRDFHATPAVAGASFGTVMLVAGTVAPLAGGYAADTLYGRRGSMAALHLMVLLFGLMAAAGLVAFRADNLSRAVMGCAAVAVLASASAVLVPLAIQTACPARMRGQMAAITLLCGNLVGWGVGPVSVALLTQYVFPTRGVSVALASTIVLLSLIGLIVSASSRAPFGAAPESAMRHPRILPSR